MEIIDYIFIICCVIGIFALLVLIIRPFIPKYMMLESKEINVNGYYDMIVDYLESLFYKRNIWNEKVNSITIYSYN